MFLRRAASFTPSLDSAAYIIATPLQRRLQQLSWGITLIARIRAALGSAFVAGQVHRLGVTSGRNRESVG
jgi:hypothetical protein